METLTFLGILIIIGLVLFSLITRFLITDKRVDGEMHVMEAEDGGKVFSLELKGDPEEFLRKQKITFKVVQNDEGRNLNND